MDRLTFESFRVVGEVVSDDPELLDAAGSVLPPGWQPSEASPSVAFGVMSDGSVTLDGVRLHEERDRRARLIRLGSVIRHHLAEAAPAHVFIHAGVVQIEGCGVVIPGATHSGKTTLVQELVRAGARYYSDEYAVVAADGSIEPFAKPLSVRPPDGNGLGEQTPVPAPQIGTGPTRAGLVLLTHYERGARWQPSVRSAGEGAFELLGHAVSARGRPTAALTAVTQVCRDARVLAGPRGEARETAHALLGDFLTGVDRRAPLR